MSADNFILIKYVDGMYNGYMYDASTNKPMGKNPLFRENRLETAVCIAQSENAEYGFRIEYPKKKRK